MQEDLKDVLLFFAAVVGTDYNSKGLTRFGKEKAKAMTRLIYQQWQATHRSGDGSRCFLDYAACVVLGQVEIDCTADKSCKTFLKACAKENCPGVSFARDLQLVVKVVLDQRAKAREQAIALKRADVMWTGEKIDHGNLISILIQANVDQEQENGVNGVLSRVMKVEAERMLRLGESSLINPLLRVSSIVKAKQVKKWEDSKVLPLFQTDIPQMHNMSRNLYCCLHNHTSSGVPIAVCPLPVSPVVVLALILCKACGHAGGWCVITISVLPVPGERVTCGGLRHSRCPGKGNAVRICQEWDDMECIRTSCPGIGNQNEMAGSPRCIPRQVCHATFDSSRYTTLACPACVHLDLITYMQMFCKAKETNEDTDGGQRSRQPRFRKGQTPKSGNRRRRVGTKCAHVTWHASHP